MTDLVGAAVEGNYGAMHPIDKGVITEVVGKTAWVRWEYESGRVWNVNYKIKDLRSAYSECSSPVGVYITGCRWWKCIWSGALI